MTAPSPSPHARAAWVVQAGLWLLALLNLGRALALWRQADWRTGLPLMPDPRWRLAIALLWAALLAAVAIGLLARRRWARRATPLLLVVLGVYELSMILRFTSSLPAWPPVLLYITFVAFTAWALWRPAARLQYHPSQVPAKEVDRRTV